MVEGVLLVQMAFHLNKGVDKMEAAFRVNMIVASAIAFVVQLQSPIQMHAELMLWIEAVHLYFWWKKVLL